MDKFPTRLGISAEVTVDITNQDLPMLSTTPSTKSVGTTNVFEINFDDVNQTIQSVIEQNMKQ